MRFALLVVLCHVLCIHYIKNLTLLKQKFKRISSVFHRPKTDNNFVAKPTEYDSNLDEKHREINRKSIYSTIPVIITTVMCNRSSESSRFINHAGAISINSEVLCSNISNDTPCVSSKGKKNDKKCNLNFGSFKKLIARSSKYLKCKYHEEISDSEEEQLIKTP
ncbi:hypothetical protein CWI36_0092p0060 [Hamiltosporidium magnivora]|uniref:Uncharacterized protein n=1 Tax=Hamiltosporidium magnivora TaxID=148818 RepID=A0A4Q9LKV1_9MICR|nr:hypothetical protein CWI36_0092p0060 [Hamiltosporidium magnivora]